LDVALDALCHEDPSLRVHFDEETGQLVMSGMGELHLEVIRSRLQNEFGIAVTAGECGLRRGECRAASRATEAQAYGVAAAGKLRVAYREQVKGDALVTEHGYQREMLDTSHVRRILFGGWGVHTLALRPDGAI
jgi:peptide subunit release factor RF-3